MAFKSGRGLLVLTTALVAVGCQTNQTAKMMNPKPAGSAVAALEARMRQAAAAKALPTPADPLVAAEAAVQADPDNLTARKALAAAYFGAGRFRSAAQAYEDALAIAPSDDTLRLKRALALLVQGNRVATLTELERVRGSADAGLAYALAGRTERGIALLDAAARAAGATARTRQNLAFAYALDGQWAQARTVAAQDLSPAAVEVRMRQWATLAASADPVTQTASLVGVSPDDTDAGRPIGLAYIPPAARFAQQAAPTPAPAAPVETIQVAAVAPSPSKPIASPAAAQSPRQWVVQLGAYDRADLLAANWRRIAARSGGMLGSYEAARSEVTIGDRRYHRLSLVGFDSRQAAAGVCESLQAKGRDCLVRVVNTASVPLARLDRA